MYGMFGGCTTLFHLAIQRPIIVLALGLAGFVYQVPSNPGPGDRFGTNGVMSLVERQILKDHPELQAKAVELRKRFDEMDAIPTENQVRQVLSLTDACTDVSADDVLSNPDERREAAWLLYLDAYFRDGPERADLLFRRSPPGN